MKVNPKRRRRFSAEFRKEQAQLIEQGKYTITDLCRKYDVCYDTVKNWVIKYGKHPYPETKWVVSQNDITKLRDQEKEIEQLKKIIGEQQVKIIYLEKFKEIIKEQYGDDIEKKI